MNNNILMDIVLDDLLQKKINREEAGQLLENDQVDDVSAEIDLHFAAAKAVQRYAVLKQVQSVHASFLYANKAINVQSVPEVIKPKLIRMQQVKWVMRIAASIIFMIGGWFAYQYNSTSSSKLYTEMYQPYNVNTDRGMGEIKTHNMIQEFKEMNYLAVIKTFESLGGSNNREKFLAAIAYHETGKYQESANVLSKILLYNKETKTRLYNDEAEFYLALSYLKMKDAASAEPLLEAIRNNPNHTFHERVSKWTLTRLNWLK